LLQRVHLTKISGIAARSVYRLLVWSRILRDAKGTGFKIQLGLFLSAVVDTFLYAIYPLMATVPKVYVSGIVYFKKYNVYFYLRRFSDDLFSVMPGREEDVNELLLKSIGEGDVFIDVGANVGYYSILLGKLVGSQGMVVAFEPVPNTAKVLQLNMKLNGLKNVRVVPRAAWSDESLLTVYVPKGYYGFASTTKWPKSNSITLKACTLDQILQGFPSIKMIKIDTEGSELQVLLGARKTLAKTKYLVIELSKDSDSILCLLNDAAFKLYRLRFRPYIFAEKRKERVSMLDLGQGHTQNQHFSQINS